ncbi:MAG: hypothetical protein ACO1NY_14405 [Pseudorhodoplanes sp.]
MEEIKRRIVAIDNMLNSKTTTSYPYTNWEFIALQFRIIFELIILSSLASNRHLFEKLTRRLAKEWQIAAIIRVVRDKNSDFYPKPIKRVPSDTPGIKDDLQEVKSGYLTLSELIRAHGMIGNAMHARNPYEEDEILSAMKAEFGSWRDKIIALLDQHLVKFPGDQQFMYVGMQSRETGGVHTAFFERSDGDPTTLTKNGR